MTRYIFLNRLLNGVEVNRWGEKIDHGLPVTIAGLRMMGNIMRSFPFRYSTDCVEFTAAEDSGGEKTIQVFLRKEFGGQITISFSPKKIRKIWI